MNETDKLIVAIMNKLKDLKGSELSSDDDSVVYILSEWFSDSYPTNIDAASINLMSDRSFEGYVEDAYQDFVVGNKYAAKKLRKWFGV